MNYQFKYQIQKQVDVESFLNVELDNLNIVLPGDIITSEQGYMNGHGTFKIQDKIYSSLVGTVEKTNKLILVNPLKCNYTPQVGDIVIGRVIEISNRKWKIDINASSDAQLNLNSTYLPQQRIKTEEDELNMRILLNENDICCCEIHSVNNDKTINLHTRSLKYGRLQNGQLVQVHNKLIKRQKHHFIKLPCGINVIFGHNGNIWLSNIERDQPIKEQNQINPKDYTVEEREKIAKIANILKFLNQQQVEISIDSVNQIFDQFKDLRAKQLLESEHQDKLCLFLKEKIETKIPGEINKIVKKVDQYFLD